MTGDTYIDSAHIGVAVIGRVLLAAGYRVGIIAQPDVHSARDIGRLGQPALFWGVSGGCVDSLVANYTAGGKRRKSDDLTPGGVNNRRPDRAVIVYSNLIRRFFKATRPIVLGGIEASLRRIAHYDGWSNSVRRAILFDAKADLLVYGMAEQTVLELAARLARGEDIRTVRGICYISPQPPAAMPQFPGPDIELPPHPLVAQDDDQLSAMFRIFYANADPFTARRLTQRQDTRYLVQNPPPPPPSPEALDRIYELPYARDVHPFYGKDGPVKALETIRFSLTSHRGCYGECRFCAIAVHQGRHVVSRSEDSLLREAADLRGTRPSRGSLPMWAAPRPTCTVSSAAAKRTRAPAARRAASFPHPAVTCRSTTAARSGCWRPCAGCPGCARSLWPPESATI